MPDEPRLREQARAAIQAGKLPRRPPDRTWGGPGVGAACAVCERPVTKDEMEFEIQFARAGSNPDFDKYHIHIRCFAAWEFEREGQGRGRDAAVKEVAVPVQESKPIRCPDCGVLTDPGPPHHTMDFLRRGGPVAQEPH